LATGSLASGGNSLTYKTFLVNIRSRQSRHERLICRNGAGLKN
jgi:hypothetical protein